MARGFVVQPTYRVRGGVPVVQLYGRLESGEPFLVEDDRFRPYFFAPRGSEAALAGEDGVTIAESELRGLRGEPLVRVEAPVPGAVPRLRERLAGAGHEAFEADVRFAYRYLIDHGIRATLGIHSRGTVDASGLVHFVNPELAGEPADVALRTLSLDLETTPDASQILSAALVCAGVEEVHVVAPQAVRGAVSHPEEPALLSALAARIRDLDPDLLLGWNVVDFDLRVLLARCEACGIPARLGRSAEAPRLLADPGPMRQSRAEVPGRMVLDGIPLVRDALRLPDYRLETVARAVLGRSKKIDPDAPDAAAEILRMWREDPEALVAYNLEDARLVPEILAKEGLLDLTLERSRLSGMQLDRVGASIASFDLLYLPELRRRGFAAPSADPDRKHEALRGGALLEPQPGLHPRVAVFDFKSLYPSLIRTFALDPLAHARAGAAAVTAPNGARFSPRDAILPTILERFRERREDAKARGDRHADQAIKIMMNALYGVLGAASCRFFDPEVANAITGFGQQILHWTRDAFEGAGVAVLYGDTDSVFIQLPEAPDRAALEAAADALRTRIETDVATRIEATYGVPSRLELELEKIFDLLLLPRVRGGRGGGRRSARGTSGSAGSKKRYAGWADGKLVVVGLEAVRRDWPDLAHRLQEGMLERLFTGRDPAPFVREVVEDLRAGRCDAELVYVKRLRKGALDRYAANAPHVQAARKAARIPGGVIRYVITRTGPEPVLPGQPVPRAIDHPHYVEKVVQPVADSILEVIGSSFDEAMGAPTQMQLL
jgi:DNA polymerase-2